MGMESVYKLSVILNLVDNLSGQMNSVQSSVSGSVDKLNSAFGTMQKAGVAMAGIGGTITGLAMKTVTATFDTQNALGELSSLGVKDLKAVEDAAKSFSNTWAGTSKADFITASYDIKSGIASLTDEGVAQFTQLAALTGKATKSTTEEMGSLFATGYGIYKGFYDDMSDLEFGEMFSAGIATAVKNYKTSGSEMASAISALGATATNANVPLEEQLAIMGQLQTTMSGSEAATKYKSFLNQAYEIPFGINVFIFILACIHMLLDLARWKDYVIGFFAVSAFLYLLYLLSKGRAIGGGDIKLMAAAGMMLGWKAIIIAFVMGCILGSVIHSLRMKLTNEDHVLAMGPYLAAGILLAALWGDSLLQMYMRLW